MAVNLKQIEEELRRIGVRVPERATRAGGSGSAVAEIPFTDVIIGSDIAEAFYYGGADAPRQRFPLASDRGAIDKLRKRLSPIWLENLIVEGAIDSYDNAVKCGWLSARQCSSASCGIVQASGEQTRRSCKQRGCPLCMGIQARKPLWAKEAALAAERDLALYIVDLGSYDINTDGLHPAGTARQVVGQAYQWMARLAQLKDCPETVKNSFSGVRADLHQGYLTMSLTILGPSEYRTVGYLQDYFQQATERTIKVDTFRCENAKEAINIFGNLHSTMAVYDNVEDCQTMMEAFKGKRLVQPRGRMLNARKSENAEDVSSSKQGESLLETSSAETSIPKGGGGGVSGYKCHHCGAPTTYIGRMAGDWVKTAKGLHSGETYWHLVAA